MKYEWSDSGNRDVYILRKYSRSFDMAMLLVVVAFAGVGAGIALLSPDDVISRSAVLSWYVGWLKDFFPLERFAKDSSFKQVTMFYQSIVFYSYPLIFVMVWRYLLTRKRGLLTKKSVSLGERAILLFFSFPLGAALTLVFCMYYSGGDTRLIKFGTSRLALAWCGTIPFWAVAFFSVGSFWCFIRPFKKYI